MTMMQCNTMTVMQDNNDNVGMQADHDDDGDTMQYGDDDDYNDGVWW